MTGLPLFLLVAFIMTLLLLHRTGRKYRALWRPDRLTEMAEGIAKLRVEADSAGNESDPTWTSSAGYRFAYRIESTAEGIAHSISLSYRGGGFAVTAAGFLALFVREVLDLEAPAPELLATREGRYRLRWTHPLDEHRRRMATAVRVPDRAEARDLARRCWEKERWPEVRPASEDSR